MVALTSLWLPILLSAVAVFLASFVFHMLLPWHHDDYRRVPNEDQVMDALRPFGIPPGDYMLPRPAAGTDMRSPEFTEKLNRGPILIFTALPNGVTPMGRTLALWFVYCAVVAGFAGCVAGTALPAGAPFWSVFHFAAITAFAGYALALWQLSIWYRRQWSTTIKSTIDGLVYALLTAGVFGWLWPK